MSKTYRSLLYNRHHSYSDKKFFGHTSGQHHRSHIQIPMKNTHYVKYGYPCELRSKKQILEHIYDEEDAIIIRAFI